MVRLALSCIDFSLSQGESLPLCLVGDLDPLPERGKPVLLDPRPGQLLASTRAFNLLRNASPSLHHIGHLPHLRLYRLRLCPEVTAVSIKRQRFL